MAPTLIEHVDCLVTMDDARREWRDAAVFVDDHIIAWVGLTSELPPRLRDAAGSRLDGRKWVVLPGFVNTHHHFYQTLTRVIPTAQNVSLFGWLRTLYPIWAELEPQDVRLSTRLALTELLLSGCTTSSDHHYLWPNGCRLDDQFEAASEIGVRFHGARGSMSLGESQGGLPPDRVTEPEEAILRDSRRVIEAFHDPARYAMRRVALAPCSPFSVTPDLMRESAALARSFGQDVRLHTHLAESRDEEAFCIANFGARPTDYAEQLGWLNRDVWHAHCVHLHDGDVGRLAATRTGVAHCPTSNMRLASGIAPIRALCRAGVPVGLGVDGSASNDGSHLLGEARQAMLLQRVLGEPDAMTARQALELATRGGAALLGRDDIGVLAPGMAADLIAFRTDSIALAGGGVHDPVAALVFCQPQNVDFAMVHGRILVRDGLPTRLDTHDLVSAHNRAARQLLARAGLA